MLWIKFNDGFVTVCIIRELLQGIYTVGPRVLLVGRYVNVVLGRQWYECIVDVVSPVRWRSVQSATKSTSHLMPCTCMPPPPHAFTISSQDDWVIMAMDGAAKMTVNSQHYNSTVTRQNESPVIATKIF